MTTYIMKVREPWFSLIKVGKKKVEGRLNKGLFSKLNIGDTLVFTNNEIENLSRECKVKVKNIINYQTFYNYLKTEKLKNCLPGIDNLDDGVSIYYGFYSKADEDKFKVLAIKIKRLKN